MIIKLPDDHEIRVESTLEIAKKLIKLRYWDRIETADLNAWFGNFKTDEEKYFASGILLSIIYRSQKSIATFGANIIQIMLPNLLSRDGHFEVNDIESWERQLEIGKKSNIPVRFSTLEGVGDKPGKSGSQIYRKIAENFFHTDLGVRCENLKKEIIEDKRFKVLVLFDDIIGTGTQFKDYVDEFKLDECGVKIYYFPFAAYKDSYELLNNVHNNIYINPVEIITENESLFSENNLAFFNRFHSENSPEELKKYYLDICIKYNIRASDKLGFGELALTYIFNNSMPNNNIALLWYKSSCWNKLVAR